MNEQFPLDGLQVLIVEDVFLVALDLSDQLTDSGCAVIGPAASVKQALEGKGELAPPSISLTPRSRGLRLPGR